MERPTFFYSPFVDLKPRHIPPYPPPLSPEVKHPISSSPRVPVTKPSTSYRIDDILSRPDPRPAMVSLPTTARYRTNPGSAPSRLYGYGHDVPYLWSAMLQSQFRERLNGMLSLSCVIFMKQTHAYPIRKKAYIHAWVRGGWIQSFVYLVQLWFKQKFYSLRLEK